jgi:hypothetical protein
MKTKPINVFVHVPKTAGSTVNEYLKRSGAPGASHVEAWVDKDTSASENLLRLDWVSGHVPFPKMRARLSANTFRNLRFFTLMRDPVKQLMSHYNWLIEIHHRGGAFYDNHPVRIKEISQSIRSADNNNPMSIIAQIEATPRLFLNQQSVFILGTVPQDVSEATLKERLSVYNQVATESELPELIKRISGVSYEDSRRENVSPYHFDTSVFESDALKAFMQERNATDNTLYRYLKNRA